MNRQSEWNDIWNKKYTNYMEHNDLHILSGYDDLSYEEYKKLALFFILKLGIEANDNVLEVGCGSGAFLNEIEEVGTLSGIDYADDAIVKINNVLDGDFCVSEARNIPFDDNSFDIVISFGVFFYFDSLEYAANVIDEMLRVLKPNGKILIGEINDLDKKDMALKLRKKSNEKRDKHRISKSNVDHLYYPISFFEALAKDKKLEIEVIKQDIEELDFYYNASYRFSVILKNRG